MLFDMSLPLSFFWFEMSWFLTSWEDLGIGELLFVVGFFGADKHIPATLVEISPDLLLAPLSPETKICSQLILKGV